MLFEGDLKVINFFLRAVSGDAEIEFYQIVEESV
jgi:hypothetical protein